jgi:hypothetical protein
MERIPEAIEERPTIRRWMQRVLDQAVGLWSRREGLLRRSRFHSPGLTGWW